jgi:pimeloyl-ACP methyl ester carboxylesterase
MVNHTDDTIVVLIPGLWMPAWVMCFLQRKLERVGFRCTRFGYASGRAGLEENSARLAAFVRGLSESRVHLVGHSLGGVLALHSTRTHALRQVRRIVMIGSPWRDSFVARRMCRNRFGRGLLGKTVPQWLACAKPPAPDGVLVGAVAGTLASGLGRLFAPGMPRPHDGVIRVEETAVQGMAAYIELRVSHAGMLLSSCVAERVGQFLLHGRFEPAARSELTLPAKEKYALGRGRESR